MTSPTERPGLRWTRLGLPGYPPPGVWSPAGRPRREMSFIDYYLIVLFVALIALLVYKFKS